MITIANGFWMNNTISHARIISVIKGAEASFQSGTVDHSRDMELSERMIDYVFCGRVKERYMNSLHELVLARLEIDRSVTNNRSTVRDRQPLKIVDPDKKIKRIRARLAAFMPEQTLQLYGDPKRWDNYLTLRNRRGQITGGIPLHAAAAPPRKPTSTNLNIPAMPKVETEKDIWSSHVEDIQKSGGIICQDQSFTVRFTASGEPIVLFSDDYEASNSLQRKLHNLWSISEARRLAPGFQSGPIHAGRLHFTHSDPRYTTEFTGRVNDKFAIAVNIMNIRLKAERAPLDAELDRFETLSCPTADEKRAFVLLQKKLAALNQLKNQSKEEIALIRKLLQDICSKVIEIEDHENGNPSIDVEPLKIRVLNFFEHINRFCALKVDKQQISHIRSLCAAQNEFFSNI